MKENVACPLTTSCKIFTHVSPCENKTDQSPVGKESSHLGPDVVLQKFKIACSIGLMNRDGLIYTLQSW